MVGERITVGKKMARIQANFNAFGVNVIDDPLDLFKCLTDFPVSGIFDDKKGIFRSFLQNFLYIFY